MTFEEDPKLRPISELLVEARKRIGRVDKTHQASDGSRSFSFLGVKDAVEACRAVFDELGIIPKLSVVSGTYLVTDISSGNGWKQFQAVAEFDVTFEGPMGDSSSFRVVSAAVDDRDKFSATLNSVAMREGIKAAMLMYDGEENIEDNISKIPASGGQQRRPVAGNSGTGPKGSISEPMATKSERLRLQEIVGKLGEEKNVQKLEEVAGALELLGVFDPNNEGELRKHIEQSVWTAAMDVLRRNGYLDTDDNTATTENRKLVVGMVKHAKAKDSKHYEQAVKPALAELDIFTSNGQVKKKLSKDQYQTAMHTLADLGFDEPFDVPEDPTEKIVEIKTDLETKPDLPQIDDNLTDIDGNELTRETAEQAISEDKQAALDAAVANIDGLNKGMAGLKGQTK